MFESISILPNSTNVHKLNVGDLAEKLLYYKHVHVFLNQSNLSILFEYFEIDVLIEYIKSDYITIYHRKASFGAGLHGSTYISQFFFDANYDLKKVITDAYFEYSKDMDKSRSVANRLYRHIQIWGVPSSFGVEVNNHISDPAFVKKVISENHNYYRPNDPFDINNLEFSSTSLGDHRLEVSTNIDVEKYPFLDPRSIILNVGTSLEDLKIAANYNTEIALPELNSRIVSVKVNSLIAETAKSIAEINVFQHVEFNEGPGLREVINDKHKTMREFLSVLKHADKFKEWLNDLGPNNNLLREYVKKINEKTWIESIPSKASRFYLLQGASAILKNAFPVAGIGISIVLSALNTFVIEKLVKNWKPNHFIQGEVKPFLDSAQAGNE